MYNINKSNSISCNRKTKTGWRPIFSTPIRESPVKWLDNSRFFFVSVTIILQLKWVKMDSLVRFRENRFKIKRNQSIANAFQYYKTVPSTLRRFFNWNPHNYYYSSDLLDDLMELHLELIHWKLLVAYNNDQWVTLTNSCFLNCFFSV